MKPISYGPVKADGYCKVPSLKTCKIGNEDEIFFHRGWVITR